MFKPSLKYHCKCNATWTALTDSTWCFVGVLGLLTDEVLKWTWHKSAYCSLNGPKLWCAGVNNGVKPLSTHRSTKHTLNIITLLSLKDQFQNCFGFWFQNKSIMHCTFKGILSMSKADYHSHIYILVCTDIFIYVYIYTCV